MVSYTMQQAIYYSRFDRVIISTDDSSVTQQSFIENIGRPAELATDTASKWDVFRYIAHRETLKPDDILVDLDIGCPLRSPQDITACIEKLQTSKFDVVATAYESDRNPYFNMVEGNENYVYVVGDGEYHHNITRRQDAPEVWSLSPAVFAVRVAALEKYDHWSEVDHMGIVIIPRERAWDIDTELDFRIVEFLMKGE